MLGATWRAWSFFAVIPRRGRLFAQRHQRADGPVSVTSGRRCGDGLVRLESRSAPGPGRGDAAAWLEVVVHQHMPMFHMEHCVFLRGALARHEQDQLRPPVRHARGEAARPHRHGASAARPTSAAATRSTMPCRKARPKRARPATRRAALSRRAARRRRPPKIARRSSSIAHCSPAG